MSLSVSRNSYKEWLVANSDTDFVVGNDQFDNLTINPVEDIQKFHYFHNKKKTVVKRFVLRRTMQVEKICLVTLIKKDNGKFEPRFCFQTNDLTKKAVESFDVPVSEGEHRLIKARVDLGDCHKEFTNLLDFLGSAKEVEVALGQYAVVTVDQKQQLDKAVKAANKDEVVQSIGANFARQITEKDINLMTRRREALQRFRKLLDQKAYFNQYRQNLKLSGKNDRPEDVWQSFFEDNRWIFGYGLQLVACEGLDDKKLESIVVGNDLFDGAGKRIDGLLKTQGAINRALFTELKRHDIDLLESYDRPGVWSPSKDLRGAVAQVQKTVHKVSLKLSKNFEIIADKNGEPTGEIIALVKPRGIVIAGRLEQFKGENGINWEKFSSFELYRQQQTGVEIITYDEFYERARYIIEEN